MRHAKIFYDQLADLMAARAHAEETYVKHLQKVAKRVSEPNYMPVEFRPLYQRLLAEMEDVAQLHTTFQGHLQRASDQLRQAHTQGEWAKLAQQDDVISPILKEINSLEAQLGKGQRKLEQKRQSTAAVNKVLSTQESLTQAQSAWRERALRVFQSYERADYQRLHLLRDTCKHVIRAESELAKAVYDTARSSAEAAQAFRPVVEMQRFAGVYRTESTSSPSAVTMDHNVPLPSYTIAHARESPVVPSSPEAPPRPSTSASTPSYPTAASIALPSSATRPASRLPPPAPTRSVHKTASPPTSPPVPTNAMTNSPPVASSSSVGHSTVMHSAHTHLSNHTTAPSSHESRAGPGTASTHWHDAMPSPPLASVAPASTATPAPPLPMSMSTIPVPLRPSTQLRQPMQPRTASLALGPPATRRAPLQRTGTKLEQGHAAALVSPLVDTSITSPSMSEAQFETMVPTSNPMPVHAHIEERVSAHWKQGTMTHLVIEGQVNLRATPALGSTSMQAHARIQVDGMDYLSKTRTHPCFTPTSVPGVYDLDLQALLQHAPGDGVSVFEYEVLVDDAYRMQFVPLLLDVQWRCESTQSSVLVHHRENPEFAYRDTVSLPAPSFSLQVPQDAYVTGDVLSEPIGTWDPDAREFAWQANHVDGRGAVRFPLASQATPWPIAAAWSLPSYSLSPMDVHVDDHAPLTLTSTTRAIVAGSYVVEP